MSQTTLTPPGRAEPHGQRLPVGPDAQFAMLHDHLLHCERVLDAARNAAAAAMRDPEMEERERWAAVRRLRTLAWKVSREILPLLTRVPSAMQHGAAWTDCLRTGHRLRRTVETAMRDNANFTVDLVVAAGLSAGGGPS